MGINVEDCHGVGTSACSAIELARYGTIAVSHPASCAFINWRYEDSTWRQPEIREGVGGAASGGQGPGGGGVPADGGWRVRAPRLALDGGGAAD